MDRIIETPYALVAIAASAGGVEAVSHVLSELPASFPVPIALVLHRTARAMDRLPNVLQRCTTLRVRRACAGEPLEPGTVYIAPADRHLSIDPAGRAQLWDGRKIRFVHSSAN